MECTLNDVVLAICAGALRRYLDEKGALPREPLVAMVPVSTRGEDERGKMGNKVSAMFLDLATDVDDPVGARVEGPALLEQPDTTIFIEPDLAGQVDGFGNLVIARKGEG